LRGTAAFSLTACRRRREPGSLAILEAEREEASRSNATKASLVVVAGSLQLSPVVT